MMCSLSCTPKAAYLKGFNLLAEKIADQRSVIIDGYGGVLWENFREELHVAFRQKIFLCFWYDIDSCLKTPKYVNESIKRQLKWR